MESNVNGTWNQLPYRFEKPLVCHPYHVQVCRPPERIGLLQLLSYFNSACPRLCDKINKSLYIKHNLRQVELMYKNQVIIFQFNARSLTELMHCNLRAGYSRRLEYHPQPITRGSKGVSREAWSSVFIICETWLQKIKSRELWMACPPWYVNSKSYFPIRYF